MRLGQHMKLAPRMIQSMEILQMPLAELQERIQQELENNPTLELAEQQGEEAIEAKDDDVEVVAGAGEDTDGTDLETENEGALSDDEAVLDAYREQRQSAGGKAETFIATLRRVGIEPFKAAANTARFAEKQVEA